MQSRCHGLTNAAALIVSFLSSLCRAATPGSRSCFQIRFTWSASPPWWSQLLWWEHRTNSLSQTGLSRSSSESDQSDCSWSRNQREIQACVTRRASETSRYLLAAWHEAAPFQRDQTAHFWLYLWNRFVALSCSRHCWTGRQSDRVLGCENCCCWF